MSSFVPTRFMRSSSYRMVRAGHQYIARCTRASFSKTKSHLTLGTPRGAGEIECLKIGRHFITKKDIKNLMRLNDCTNRCMSEQSILMFCFEIKFLSILDTQSHHEYPAGSSLAHKGRICALTK